MRNIRNKRKRFPVIRENVSCQLFLSTLYVCVKLLTSIHALLLDVSLAKYRSEK